MPISNNNKDKVQNNTDGKKPTSVNPQSILSLDTEYYQSMLDGMDISKEQKQEFIEALWQIVVTFVDLGFGIESTQQAILARQGDAMSRRREIAEHADKNLLSPVFGNANNTPPEKEKIIEEINNETR